MIEPAPGVTVDGPSTEIERLLDVARSALGMDVAFITALDGDSQFFTHMTAGADSFGWTPGTTIPAVDGYCQYVISGELPNSIPDSRVHPLARVLPSTSAAGIGSYVGVPITLPSGRVYGALCSTSHDPRTGLGPQEVALMNFLATLVGDQLARAELGVGASMISPEIVRGYLEDGLEIVTQPIVELSTGRITAVEALSRFAGHAPAEVFAAADAHGLGVALELAAARTALEALPGLPESTYLTINLSPDALASENLAELLEEVPAGRVMLELTEHVPFTDITALRQHLAPYRQRGIRLGIDDTGSGYAGLQIVLALSPDVIKLDIALVTGIDHDPVRRALAGALHSFATESDAVIIAEGIQTQAELDTIQTLGIRYGQGFHLHKPTPLTHINHVIDASHLRPTP